MPLTELQTSLLDGIRHAVTSTADRRVVYRTEYLGYLPFGLYHWVKADDKDISLQLPLDFSRGDFDALERAGYLRRVDEWANPDDGTETSITFEVAAA